MCNLRCDLFSVEAERFVAEIVEEADAPQLPACNSSLELRTATTEFVILAGTAELFVTESSNTYTDFCLDSHENETAAVYCSPGPDCAPGVVCLSACSAGDTTPPPGSLPPGYALAPRPPACPALLPFAADEFTLEDDGTIQLGQHTIHPGRYCLQLGEKGGLEALVCDTVDIEHRTLLAFLASSVTPVLLIISEIFLLLTFVLHVIVPELRKQMFGKFRYNINVNINTIPFLLQAG